MSEDIYVLIQKYRESVAAAAGLLRHAFGTDRPLEAWRQGAVPISGAIGNKNYRFHGVGCELDFGDYLVDFDFGPEGQVGGFDAWRLWRFAKQFSEEFAEFRDSTDVEVALRALEQRGEIEKRLELPTAHLFWLRSATKGAQGSE